MAGVVFLVVLVVIVAVIGFWIMGMYNRLVSARQQAEEAWSGIDVQLKRRTDLIPNLVETVKGYAGHENETLKSVTEMRSRAQGVPSGDVAARAAAEGGLGAALGRLMAVAEAYPALKADQRFGDLQKTLGEIESEVQMSRRYYNGATRQLNTMVESFPSNLIASQFQFHKRDYFELESETERAVPEVKF